MDQSSVSKETKSIDYAIAPLILEKAYWAMKAVISAKVKEGLKAKLKEHNDKHGSKKGKK